MEGFLVFFEIHFPGSHKAYCIKIQSGDEEERRGKLGVSPFPPQTLSAIFQLYRFQNDSLRHCLTLVIATLLSCFSTGNPEEQGVAYFLLFSPL